MNFLKTNKYFIAAIAILLIIIMLQQCSSNKKQEKIEDLIELRKFDNARLDSFSNKFNQLVTESEVAKVNNEKYIEELSKTVFNLTKSQEKLIKEYHALLKIKQEVRIDTLLIPYDSSQEQSPVPIDSNGMVKADSVVLPPKNFSTTTKNYTISGTVLLKSVRINSIFLPDTASFRIVDKSTGFLKKRETVIQAIHTNPYFTNSKMQVVMKRGDKPTRWQRWIKPVITFAAGSFLTYKVLK